MRNFFFAVFYWVISIAFGLSLALLGLFRLSKPARALTVWYARAMRFNMRIFARIKFEYRGAKNLPDGPFIIAAKHQSWGDGFGAMAYFGDVAFVTGDHLEKIPLLGGVLKTIGAIVVDNCGGHTARKNLAESFEIAAKEGRPVLIYPEGHLVKIGERIKYRSGVYHMQQACNWPVVPLATNLGLFWSCEDYKKEAGTAINEFLEPIPPGLTKAEFMARLETALNEGSQRLCIEGQKAHPNLTQAKTDWPDEINSVR